MTWSVEIKSPVSAARMFEAAVLDWHNLGPKIVPEILPSSSADGVVRQLNFTSEMPFRHLKERMDHMGTDGGKVLECLLTTIEGGYLETKVKSESTHYKIEPASDGGCVVKVVANTEPLPGINADDIDSDARELVDKHLKAAEMFLLANPDQYIGVASAEGEVVAPQGRTRGLIGMIPHTDCFGTGRKPYHWCFGAGRPWY